MSGAAPVRVTVWGENVHEHSERDAAAMAERYPDGMHGAIAAGLVRAAAATPSPPVRPRSTSPSTG